MIHSTRPALLRWLTSVTFITCCGVLAAVANVRPTDPARVPQPSPPVTNALDRPLHQAAASVVSGAVPKDPRIEARISELLRKLTLEQKVAQMVQADIRYVTPEDVKTYRLGSILNGGGAFRTA